ncbi:MAG: Gfo/Idh/MocA family oxidoreductase [Planctomycetes bacterium]|nr:Gfo/Idh/MocA family oxidoreductase [Planctomycetota bacterium]
MDKARLRVLVVGYGYWGPNLVRNLVHCPLTQVTAVCDADVRRLAKARGLFPFVETHTQLDAALQAGVDAVVIATPVSTHYPIALRCLDAGKHLLIEKPLTRTSAEGADLVARAQRAGKVLMVDHTFLFSPAVRRIKQMVESGDLGDIFFVDSVRINLGLVQRDINVIWDLAPHDLSIIDYWLVQVPARIAASGKSHVNNQEDVALVTLDYDKRLFAGLHVNWLSPVKIRQTVLGGSRRSVVYNDNEPTEKIRVYDRQIECSADPEDKHRVLFDYRLGDMWSPYVGTGEPLQAVVQHFAECALHDRTPLSDGVAGLRIVQMLEATDRSLGLAGQAVPFLNTVEAPRLPLAA